MVARNASKGPRAIARTNSYETRVTLRRYADGVCLNRHLVSLPLTP